MQSTSVEVVSENPAAGAESPGQATIPSATDGATGVRVADGCFEAAAPAVCGTIATVAQTTAKLNSSALRFLILVSILPPYSRTNSRGYLRIDHFFFKHDWYSKLQLILLIFYV
jgi:hypothetical protein